MSKPKAVANECTPVPRSEPRPLQAGPPITPFRRERLVRLVAEPKLGRELDPRSILLLLDNIRRYRPWRQAFAEVLAAGRRSSLTADWKAAYKQLRSEVRSSLRPSTVRVPAPLSDPIEVDLQYRQAAQYGPDIPEPPSASGT